MSGMYKVKLRRSGTITNPKELREKNHLTAGDMLTLTKLSAEFLVVGKPHFQVDAVANHLANEWQDAGESLASMLKTLQELRDEQSKKKL